MKTEKKQNSLDPLDLRMIVEVGKRNRLAGYDALSRKGLIKSPIEEFIKIG